MSNKHLSIAKLLQEEPLYRKVEINQKYFHPDLIDGITFQFYCPNENSIQTFKLSLGPEKLIQAAQYLDAHRFQDLFNPFSNNNDIDIIQHFIGTCQYCNSYKSHFLLHIFSEGTVEKGMFLDMLGRPKDIESTLTTNYKDVKVYIRKVGQWPSFQITPNATIYNFLNKEDKSYYNKALICLSQNYGVAAFAYLRKIVESEIVRIVEELAKGGSGDIEKIKSLLEEFRIKRQMGPLVENIYQYLPNSLKVLGDNPFKLLYSYLSEGLHNHSDEECLSYANGLNKLLEFTIKKVREDQNELSEIKSVLNELKNTNKR
jgi:hypothetical protein